MEDFYTVDDLAKTLKISRPWLYQLIREQRIPYVRVAGKAVRFRASEIEQWLNEGRGVRYYRDKCRIDPSKMEATSPHGNTPS